MSSAPRVVFRALLVVLSAVLSPAIVSAQGSLRGRVVDGEMGTPVAGATVRIGKNGPTVRTDSGGYFLAQNVTSGLTAIEIKQIGFEPGVFDVRIRDSAVVEGVFPLDFNGYQLPPVVVEARAEALAPRYSDFEHRRHASRRGMSMGSRCIPSTKTHRFATCTGSRSTVARARSPRSSAARMQGAA